MEFRVPYTAYEGQSSWVLSEGEMTVNASSANQAENQVKAMVGAGGTNRVIIHGVFNN
jgi:hypothetical protein